MDATAYSACQRLDAVIGLLVDSHTERLATKLGVDRARLILARNGRRRPEPCVYRSFEEKLHVREHWLRHGSGQIFVPGRSPGAEVEDAILLQLEHGAPRARSVPLIEGAAPRPGRQSCGSWWTTASRALIPPVPLLDHGYYAAATEADAEVIGCEVGDLVLYADAPWYFARHPLAAGDSLVAVAAGRRKGTTRLVTLTVIIGEAVSDNVTPEVAKIQKHADTVLRSDDGEECLVQVKSDGAVFKGIELKAVALKVERDLVRRHSCQRT